MRRFSARFIFPLIALTVIFLTEPASASRIKDLARLNGVRNNQLIGYGLITGLNSSGDDMRKSLFTTQAIYNMMAHNGITIDATQMRNLKMRNIAAVMVTAQLPPFAKPGSTIDVQVSSVGDATSLAGGTLLMTPLRGVDGQVYALAQGPLTVGAFSYGGKAARAQKNHPTVGNIPGGALVEDIVPVALGEDGALVYQLNQADFTTATRIAEAIDGKYGVGTAFPGDSGSVKVTIPKALRGNVVEFVASIESLNVEADTSAKVVVNERTGTVVMGKDVRLSTVAVSHGNLNLIIRENEDVVQPNPLSQGQTATVTSTDINVKEEQGELVVLDMEGGVSIGEIANALNAIGATPRDLIAIFQAIKAAGSMHSELIIL